MKRMKTKGRRESGPYFALPHAVMDSENYRRLSSKGVKIVNDLGRQYNGKNNGDLCAAWSMMEKRGWKSRSTLHEAIKEAIHYGLIMLTRQGGKHKPNLYALTWNPIDECKGKLDVRETVTAPGIWKEPATDFTSKRIMKDKTCTLYSNTLTLIKSNQATNQS